MSQSLFFKFTQKQKNTQKQFQQTRTKMIVKKVFDVTAKSIQQKPLHVKPKYKTYRQLLQLDKPKKIIEKESDSENDDFLQKIMKKQQQLQKLQKKMSKEKKFKSSASKNHSKSKNHTQQSQNSLLPFYEKKQEIILLPKIQNQNQNENLSQQSLESSHINSKRYQIYSSQNQVIQKYQERIENESKDKQSPLTKKITVFKRKKPQETNLWQILQLNSNKKHKKSNRNREDNKTYTVLKLSSGENNKSVKNNFFASLKSRKSDGMKQLQKQTHEKLISIADQNLFQLQSKLNPEKAEVQHQLNLEKIIKSNMISYSMRAKEILFKSASCSPAQTKVMMNKTTQASSSQKKLNLRHSLFKTSYQEELFLKSLKKSPVMGLNH